VSAGPLPTETSDGGGEHERLAALGIERLRAENAGAYTLGGTNTWVLGSDPAYVVDPGPVDERHVSALVELVGRRGGLGGVALTHDHEDHSGALPALLSRCPAPLAAGRPQRAGGEPQVLLADGASFGPLRAFATPGHSADHYAFIYGEACFTGDAVLGEGSVFLTPDRGALAGYLTALQRLAEFPLVVICPGHGPAVWEPRRRLLGYVAHRLERERRLRSALGDGRRTVDELLDSAWTEVPQQLRPLAAVTLAAHLDKLEEEGELPTGVERPAAMLPSEPH
jgi:glyoxylase-like metal-dependent hydrolase (beta-lactamase superfamily II)